MDTADRGGWDRMMRRAWMWGLVLLWATNASAQVLTVDEAVKLALHKNVDVIGAEANVLEARGALYNSWSPLLPNLRISATRFNTITTLEHQTGVDFQFGVPLPFTSTSDFESHGTTPSLSGQWNILNLSNWAGHSAARHGMQAAQFGRQATRNDVALAARRQFYAVVTAVRLDGVANSAAKLARDDERRVRALFEVGSVSRSDLLKAEVRTAQSELDSLTGVQAVVNQRIALAELIGIREQQMAPVDTAMVFSAGQYDEAQLVTEAAKQRPDLMAADRDLASAKADVRSAKMAWLPYITASGSMPFNTSSRQVSTVFDSAGKIVLPSLRISTDQTLNGSLSLNWDIFTGFATQGRIAVARARQLRSEETRAALYRNLESEVHQAIQSYREALERDRVARRGLESAVENLKLTQEKYNVGSATILDLIDAQVQLQRAQSDTVVAQAAIVVAEAQLNRVRGRAE
jgi:outer membrane protein TolC